MADGFALWANPSSPHAEGRAARRALEDARQQVKEALLWDGEVIITSGASEALALAFGRRRLERAILAATEHDAVFRCAPDATQLGLDGPAPDANRLAQALGQDGPALVAVQHVNSETGVVMPVAALAPTVRAADGLILSDCSQSAGKLVLPDADMLVISAHKFGGPIGVGALLVKDFAMLEPTGGHERGYRQGTENLPAVLGMAAALEAGGLDSWATSAEERLSFRQELAAVGTIIKPGDTCDWITALAHPRLSAQVLLMRLDAAGIAVSAGSACSSGTLKRSRALSAFGVEENVAQRTIRISLGWNTRGQELERFVQALASL